MRQCLPTGRQAKGGREPFLVKTDNHLIADKDDRHTHLARFLDRFLALFQVMRNVVFGVSDTSPFKKILGHLTEVAGRGAVNSYLFIHDCFVICRVYHATLSTLRRPKKDSSVQAGTPVRDARIELALTAGEAVVLPLN